MLANQGEMAVWGMALFGCFQDEAKGQQGRLDPFEEDYGAVGLDMANPNISSPLCGCCPSPVLPPVLSLPLWISKLSQQGLAGTEQHAQLEMYLLFRQNYFSKKYPNEG